METNITMAAICCRNLSLGGPEVCTKMVDHDVMTPLSTFVRQVFNVTSYYTGRPPYEYVDMLQQTTEIQRNVWQL